MRHRPIDITRALSTSTAPWPGDVSLGIEWTLQMARGDAVSVSRVSFSPHVGTHADAPAHYLADGSAARGFELSAFLGQVRVVDARGHAAVTCRLLTDELAIGWPRVLVRTLERVRSEEFVRRFPPLAPEAARTLVEAGLVLYGTDAPSVDPVDSKTMDAHRVLGARGVPILENLDLTRAEPGVYDLVALPMKLTETEAAPVRAVLLSEGTLRSRAVKEP